MMQPTHDRRHGDPTIFRNPVTLRLPFLRWRRLVPEIPDPDCAATGA